jgi:hypothetical protein
MFYQLLGIPAHLTHLICRYMGICLADIQHNIAFPTYIKVRSVSFFLSRQSNIWQNHDSDGPVEYEYRYLSEEVDSDYAQLNQMLVLVVLYCI